MEINELDQRKQYINFYLKVSLMLLKFNINHDASLHEHFC